LSQVLIVFHWKGCKYNNACVRKKVTCSGIVTACSVYCDQNIYIYVKMF